jgi:hypothetical protein
MATIYDQIGLGRWAGHILIGKNSRHIVIITAYRPVSSSGFNTTFQQQWRLLRNRSIDHPDPRAQLLNDLQENILKWTSRKYEIVVMWDTNESITSKSSKLLQFMANTNISPIHSTFPNASYARGTSCIDFIMGSPGILAATTQSGYTSFFDGIWHSDHRGIYCDIDTNTLFYGDTTQLQKNIQRNLSSQIHSQVFRFIKALEQGNSITDILQQMTRLNSIQSWTDAHHDEFDTLDQKFTKSLLSAERKCAMPHHADWHPALHRSYQIYLYWKTLLAGQKTRRYVQPRLTNIQKHLDTNNDDIFQGNPQRPALYQLRKAKLNLRRQRQLATTLRQEHLTFLQEVLVLEGKKEKAAAVATIQRAERRARCYRKFQLYTRPIRSQGGLSYV